MTSLPSRRAVSSSSVRAGVVQGAEAATARRGRSGRSSPAVTPWPVPGRAPPAPECPGPGRDLRRAGGRSTGRRRCRRRARDRAFFTRTARRAAFTVARSPTGRCCRLCTASIRSASETGTPIWRSSAIMPSMAASMARPFWGSSETEAATTTAATGAATMITRLTREPPAPAIGGHACGSRAVFHGPFGTIELGPNGPRLGGHRVAGASMTEGVQAGRARAWTPDSAAGGRGAAERRGLSRRRARLLRAAAGRSARQAGPGRRAGRDGQDRRWPPAWRPRPAAG